MAKPTKTLGHRLKTITHKFQEITRQTDGETIILTFNYGDRDPAGDGDGPALHEYFRLTAMRARGEVPPGQRIIDDEMVAERFHFLYLTDEGKFVPDMIWGGCAALRLSDDPNDAPKLLRPDNYTVTVDGVEIGTFPGGAEYLYDPIPAEQSAAWVAAAKAVKSDCHP